MRDWLRRLGRLLLAAAEVGLAAVVLFAVAILGDIQAGVESGQYAAEPAGGFTIGFLFLWFVASLALLVLLGGHAIGWSLWTIEGFDSLDPLRGPAVRLGVELVAAIGLFFLAGGRVPTTAFAVVRDATVVLSALVLVHVAVGVGRLGRDLVARV